MFKQRTHTYYSAQAGELWDEENAAMQLDDELEACDRTGGIVDHERDSQALQEVMRGELLHHLGNMMRQLLTPAERSLVGRYYGIGQPAQPPQRIALDLEVSEGQLEAVVDKAVRKLRESDYAILLYQYLHGKRI